MKTEQTGCEPGLAAPAGAQLRRAFWAALRLCIAVGLIVLVLHLNIIDWQLVAHGLVDPVGLILPFLAVTISLHIALLRWYFLIRSHGLQIGFWKCWHIYFGSAFVSSFFIGLGGEGFRMYLLASISPGLRSHAVLSVVADRLLGIFGLLFAALLMLIIREKGPGTPTIITTLFNLTFFLAVGGACAVGLVIWVFRRPWAKVFLTLVAEWPLIGQFLLRLISVTIDYSHRPGVLVIALGLSILAHLLLGAAVVLVTQHIGLIGPAWSDVGAAGILSQMLSLVPFTPAGLGIGESAFDQLCRLLAGNNTVSGYGSAFFLIRTLGYFAVLPGITTFIWRGSPERLPRVA